MDYLLGRKVLIGALAYRALNGKEYDIETYVCILKQQFSLWYLCQPTVLKDHYSNENYSMSS